MSSFDIESLLRFSPPSYLCQKCFALYVDLPYKDERAVICSVCGVEYLPTDSRPLNMAHYHFVRNGLTIKFDDIMAHSRTLATIASSVRDSIQNPGWNIPIESLFEALGAARQFIHFTTYGMSLQLVGALRMAALHVAVRGIVANAAPLIVEELKTYASESWRLKTHVYQRSDKPDDWNNMPHQKVIVVDGLLAFKGSANLTVDGWRKAAKGLDSVEVVTDVNEVIALNNRLFSPIWARESDTKQIVMEADKR